MKRLIGMFLMFILLAGCQSVIVTKQPVTLSAQVGENKIQAISSMIPCEYSEIRNCMRVIGVQRVECGYDYAKAYYVCIEQ